MREPRHARKKRTFLEVEIHYIVPKLRLSYQGCSDVSTICLNRVSMNRIAKNRLGEYALLVGVGGVERFECGVEARGDLKVFPSELVLYREEAAKISFRNLSTKGALVVRGKNCEVRFVFGVELI
jgi:hypothetical protein